MNVLGWALCHSLWQGGLLGLASWTSLALTRNQNARLRHNLCLTALAAQVAAFLGTLMWLARTGSGRILEIQATHLSPEAGFQTQTILPLVGHLPGFHPWIPSLLTQLAGLWSLGVCMMLLRWTFSWKQAHRLMHKETLAAPASWQARLDRLRNRLRITQPVRLRLSTHASAPMIWGFWKPLILLPASALVHLDPTALEAILAHELAHLRRLDHLTLLFQHVAETLLFYHPATWWLSNQLRQLREHCCDDEAIAFTGDPLPYAEALARLETIRKRHPGSLPAVVHASHRGALMNRIQRMLTPGPQSLPAFRGIALAAFFALIGGSILLARQNTHPSEPTATPTPGAILRFSGKELQLAGYPKNIVFPVKSGQHIQSTYDHLLPWAMDVLEARLKAGQGQGTLPPATNLIWKKGTPIIAFSLGKEAPLRHIRANLREVSAGSSEPCLSFHFSKPLEGATAADRERKAMEQSLAFLKAFHQKQP